MGVGEVEKVKAEDAARPKHFEKAAGFCEPFVAVEFFDGKSLVIESFHSGVDILLDESDAAFAA